MGPESSVSFYDFDLHLLIQEVFWSNDINTNLIKVTSIVILILNVEITNKQILHLKNAKFYYHQ